MGRGVALPGKTFVRKITLVEKNELVRSSGVWNQTMDGFPFLFRRRPDSASHGRNIFCCRGLRAMARMKNVDTTNRASVYSASAWCFVWTATKIKSPCCLDLLGYTTLHTARSGQEMLE
jgi:hypothetical protein